MNKQINFRDLFLDYLEDKLSPTDRESFEAALQSDTELAQDYQIFKRISGVEQEIFSKTEIAPSELLEGVMEQVDLLGNLERKKVKGFGLKLIERLYMRLINTRLATYSAVAGAAVIVFAVIIGRDMNGKGLSPSTYSLEASEVGDAKKRQDSTVSAAKLNALGEAQVHKDLRAKKSVSGGVETENKDPSVIQEKPKRVFTKILDRVGEIEPRSRSEYKKIDEAFSDDSLIGAPPALRDQAVIGDRRKSQRSPQSRGRAAVAGKERFSSLISRIRPIPQQNTENYGEYIENARTFTSEQPVSTFSIDVDTGSYTNTRRFLRMGQLPPTESIRVEEFINYFDYDYPSSETEAFSVGYEVAPSPFAKGYHLIKFSVKAREARDLSEKGWNLVFLVDVSGSMSSADKLPLVKQSLKLLVSNMRAQDRIALVTYSGSSRVVLPSTGIANKAQIISAIEALNAGGGTNGGSGIEMAYAQAQQHFIDGGVNRVVLATDGDFNVGVTSFEALKSMIEQKRKSGITLTTLGFGTGNYNERNMEQLANKGNGNYFYLDSFQEARKVLEQDLFATMEVVAKDVKLQVEFNPAQIIQYRLIGYDNRRLKNEDFNNDRIDAGEIGSGHTVTAMYEVVFKDSSIATQVEQPLRYGSKKKPAKAQPLTDTHPGEFGFLKIRYKAPGGDKSTLREHPLYNDLRKGDFNTASNDFRFAASVAAFGETLRGGQYVPEASMADIEDIASKARGEDSRGYRGQFLELIRSAKALKR